VAVLGRATTGPASPAATATATATAIPMICVPIRWHVGFIGLVNSHWTSRPFCDARYDKKKANHYNN
jgi:hypothetical protein